MPAPATGFRLDAAIIGAQKAGTSSLFDRLSGHRAISACRPKEPHHFLSEDWREGLPAYARKFGRGGGLTLEASTSYGFLAHAEAVSARLYEHNPDLKIIFVVREPVSRIVSAYRHVKDRGWADGLSLRDVLARRPELVDNTRYASCLAPYRQRFGPKSILVLTFEEVTQRQDEAVASALAFLGLDPAPGALSRANTAAVPKLHHRHDGALAYRLLARYAPHAYERAFKPPITNVDPALSDAEKQALREILEGDIAAIEDWSGHDLRAWRSSGR